MPYSTTQRRMYMVLVTSLFVTVGMLAYSSGYGREKRSGGLGDGRGRLWDVRNMDQIQMSRGNQSHVTEANMSAGLGDGQRHPEVLRLTTMTSRGITTVKDDRVGLASPLMVERRNQVKAVCTDGSLAPQIPSVQDVLYNAKHKFYYCPVEKVASTFWRRFIYQLNHTDPVRSPFDVPIMTALRAMRHHHLPASSRNGSGLDAVLKESTKLLFVRDPHSRIFSAYVDKLLAPNPYYWKVWALPAIMRHRDNHHKVHSHAHCGHDVTFQEFVKYVINTASKVDGHVMPINRMCTPCAVPYTVIGKMETFADDIDTLFDFLHLDKAPLRMDKMIRETTLDAIADSATDALSGSWLSSSLKCISKEAVLQRIWRKSQIRGFVSWRTNLNLTPQEIMYMNSKTFIKLLTDANTLSTNKEELKIQKVQAMKEAFIGLHDESLSGIVHTYGEDLRLFSYQETPDWLEDARAGRFVDTKAFEYWRDWDLSKVLDTGA